MADLKAWPLNLTEYAYNAEDVQRWMAGKTSGVYGAEENWQVSSKSDMTVTVKARGMVGGWLSNMGQHGITFWSENDIDLTVETADGVNPRIDRVVVSWYIPQQAKLPTVSIRKGTPASSPKGAELVNDGIYAEICLAEITVAAGATSISNANIRDTRLDESLCGLVSVGLDKIPTDALYQEFIDWFENVKTVLDGDVAGNLQKQIDEVRDYAESRPVVAKGTAEVNGWTSATPSTNTVTIQGVKPDGQCDVIVGLDGSASATQREQARAAILSPTAQDTNSITITAEGAKPTVALPIIAYIFNKGE